MSLTIPRLLALGLLAACLPPLPRNNEKDSAVGDDTDADSDADTDAGSDADGDGSPASNDCDDGNAAVYPGATEVCRDGVDNDCDIETNPCVPVSEALSGADAEFTGAEGDKAGGGVAAVGDVNADGYADVLVGAGGHGEDDAGAVYLILGVPTLSSGPLADAGVEFQGERSHEYVGWALAGIGDADGDGFDDFVVGAPGDTNVGDAGAAYLILGGDSLATGPLSAEGTVYTGEAASDSAGSTVAGAGDVNDDGFADFLVGAYSAGDGGAAYLIFGGPSPQSRSLRLADTKLTNDAGDGGSVIALAGAGDVNGDSVADFLVGLPSTGAGSAFLVLGGTLPASMPLASADSVLEGERTGDQAGYSVSGPGDVDGDGYGDIFVGAPRSGEGGSNSGAVYFVQGGTLLSETVSLAEARAEFVGGATGDYAGLSLGAAGDVDADGYRDVLVGAIGANSIGAAYLLLGGTGLGSENLTEADATYTGAPSGDWVGHAVSGAGDVDADGFDDMLIGAAFSVDAGPEAGAAFLVRGIGP